MKSLSDLGHSQLARLVGSWTTEATHPAFPGVVVRGTADIEWLEGEHFLIQRSRNDHKDFPDSVSIIGFTDRGSAESKGAKERALTVHYYDSRGVFRDYTASIDDTAFRFSREADFPQRFTGTFADDGNTIRGMTQLREDGDWKDDLEITFHRKR